MSSGVNGMADTYRKSHDDESLDRPDVSAHGREENTVLLPVDFLVTSDSPRANGEDMEHVRALTESSGPLPPILVHRPTMRVVDGMHRLRAAKLCGETHIRAKFVEGSEDDAFVLAVRLNIAHGLPLQRSDRVKAAERIIRKYPDWSDRSIATVAGLSHKTIGSIRRRSAGESHQSNMRMGRDGRFRPTDRTARRVRAEALVSNNPDAPLRQISHAAGISISTAKQVRDEVRRRAAADVAGAQGSGAEAQVEPAQEVGRECPREDAAEALGGLLNALKTDPSVRHTEAGRALLRLLSVHALNHDEWRYLTDGVPAHCRGAVVQAARSCAESWDRFARQLAGMES